MMNKIAPLVLMLAVSGCMTPPKHYDFEKSREYSQSKDKTWEKLMEYFTTKGIPIKNIEKDSGIIYAEQMFAGANAVIYADCGEHGLTQIEAAKFDVNAFVKSEGSKKSKATVNLNIVAMKRFGNYPPITVQCTSKGVAEKLILDSME